jgi:Transposase zinc-binding domain
VQAIGQQPHRAPDGAPVHYERHCPEQTRLFRIVQQHAATFFAQAEGAASTDLPQLGKDEFDAFLECGILAHGFLRLRSGDCGYDNLVAFSCKLRGFCPSCGAWRLPQTAAHLIDQCSRCRAEGNTAFKFHILKPLAKRCRRPSLCLKNHFDQANVAM